MTFQIADRWFERRRIDDDITLIWEPHVTPLMRCNIWHVRGRDRDLMIDTGLGVASLREAARDLLDKPVTAVATHSHADHIGCHYEFDDCVIHPLEAELLRDPDAFSLTVAEGFTATDLEALRLAGYEIEDPYLITALPFAGYRMADYVLRAARPTRLVEEGDVIDIGDRSFEVLHLPGHSPGSIGLWEAASGTLFSGDAIYDGPLLDELEESDIEDYLATMHRLRELPARVVHAGHDPSFGRDRLIELADLYIERRAGAAKAAV